MSPTGLCVVSKPAFDTSPNRSIRGSCPPGVVTGAHAVPLITSRSFSLAVHCSCSFLQTEWMIWHLGAPAGAPGAAAPLALAVQAPPLSFVGLVVVTNDL